MQLMTVRYEIGGRERAEVVTMSGRDFTDHVERLQSPSEPGVQDYVVFGRPDRAGIAIRLSAIIALDLHDDD